MPRFLVVALLASASTLAAERPRMGVVLVVDQLSADTFEARLPGLKGGLKRLAEEGLRFRALRYDAAPTVTSAGHATLATGAYAELHGITANEWIEAETGKARWATEDPAYQVLGRPPAPRDGTAPTALRAPTLSEAVKAADARARAVVISGKERASILSAGHAADACLWFDTAAPIFTTSTWYAKELPAWVQPTNDAIAKQVAAKAFAWGAAPKGEADAEQPQIQAAIDRFEVDLALAAVRALSLGKDEVPDLLTVSFSGNDRIGHEFGPQSPEAAAELQVVDAEIGRLLEALDKAVGKGRYVVALSADHGAPPTPEALAARHLDAGRVDVKGLRELLENEADAALGQGDWFTGYKTPGYFAAPAGRAKLATIAERLRAVAKAQPGVLDLLPLSQVLEGRDSLAALYRRGAFPGRSPDFTLVPRPYWIYGLVDRAAHSTPWLYDRAVPLIFAGAGITRGQAGEAEAPDFAPTVARLLGIAAPAGATGHSIDAVFR